ncbi:excinuclease ABC subunit UvrC [Ruminiclostridium cellobioparum]|uniref:UvrABC system protein C n=2 Tax=Ruminiclostridium cellobioparum TaxID=29355 RepID=S0FQ54_RUMCE|nr:excinuclease ABC subunit UvrC [Ruminiclostridium cellobioparum]EMS70623.1 excinuclease ABC, C subunit [Ruminiclostridium cellobioparum subsp. termitidis CT1112]
MFDIQEELKKLPDKPGVYIMKDVNGIVIYVGKAVVLKNRVRQYFQNSANHPPKVCAMVSRIHEFEYIVTDTEVEALMLECNLIKKYKPKYNILLKDDKHYPYIKVTMNEQYPRILKTRRVEKDGAKYFGPYSSAFAVNDAIDTIKKLFPIKTCNRNLPRDIGKFRPCLNYHIRQCLGPCQGEVNREEYRNMMKKICSFLGGQYDEILNDLKGQMETAAQNLEFEKAAQLRNKINSIVQLSEAQKVLSADGQDRDIIGFAQNATDLCIQVFFVRNGRVVGREHFVFEGEGNEDVRYSLSTFIKQFYNTVQFVPSEIVIPQEIEDSGIIEQWLTGKRGFKVSLRVPQRGELVKFVKMVVQNAEISLKLYGERLRREGSIHEEGLKELTKALRLECIPDRIESYDISNTGSSEIVASMVVFENGRPARDEYRKFKMKSVEEQNDYASMQETLYRRLSRARRESEGEDGQAKFSKLPDLILVDGGLAHVNAAQQIADELGFDLVIAGMAKDDRHRTRALVYKGSEYELSSNMPMLRLITEIQDETHRVAVQYNRKLREKRYTHSELDDIEGIGDTRKKALIRHFKSLAAVKKAEISQLLEVDGINQKVAGKIYEYFRK